MMCKSTTQRTIAGPRPESSPPGVRACVPRQIRGHFGLLDAAASCQWSRPARRCPPAPPQDVLRAEPGGGVSVSGMLPCSAPERCAAPQAARSMMAGWTGSGTISTGRGDGCGSASGGTCSAHLPVLSERRCEACPACCGLLGGAREGEAELGESVGVDERVDLGDLPVGDGEGHH